MQDAWDMKEQMNVNYLHCWVKWTIECTSSLNSRARWTKSVKTGYHCAIDKGQTDGSSMEVGSRSCSLPKAE